jgi:apolipoprotein D and lipocalin family protein
MLALATSAFAAAPQPAKPVSADLYTGRWYEIARTANSRQADCQRDAINFSGEPQGVFSVVQTCDKGPSQGSAKAYNARGSIVPDSANAKMKLSFFGGFITQEYWIVDRADDSSWAIMATPAGHYVWLLSRRPALDPNVRTIALDRMRAMGFDLSKLVFDVGGA